MESITNAYIKESNLDGVLEKHCSQSQEGKGQKWDEGKQRWYSLPIVLLKPLADVFEAGVIKGYPRFNCLKPFREPERRFWDATMRHLEACQVDPMAIDPETGCYHAAEACFNLLMRIYHCGTKQESPNNER